MAVGVEVGMEVGVRVGVEVGVEDSVEDGVEVSMEVGMEFGVEVVAKLEPGRPCAGAGGAPQNMSAKKIPLMFMGAELRVKILPL